MPRPNVTEGKYLLTPPDSGYPFGVAAESSFGTELHGTFPTKEAAVEYALALRSEYSDYDTVTIVKIETPFVAEIA